MIAAISYSRPASGTLSTFPGGKKVGKYKVWGIVMASAEGARPVAQCLTSSIYAESTRRR